MKKFVALALAALMCLPLAACGKSDKPSGGDSSTPAFVSSLQNKGKLIVGTSPDYEPYEFYDEKGNVIGFDIDMLNQLIKIINEDNKTSLTLEITPMEFDTIVSAVQAGQVDIGVSAFTYDKDRDVLFSSTYLDSAQAVVVKAGSTIKILDDLKDKKIGAGLGTTGEAASLEYSKDVTSPGDYVLQFEALKNGALEAVVCDAAVAKNYGDQEAFEMLPDYLIDEENKIITKKGNDELIKVINAAVEKYVASPEYSEAQTKWKLK